MRRQVVLPATFGARSPVTAPSGAKKETPSTATTVPKRLWSPSARIIVYWLLGDPFWRLLADRALTEGGKKEDGGLVSRSRHSVWRRPPFLETRGQGLRP